MATVNIVLVIFIVRCAIVMSEYHIAERNDETSPSSAEQQMALIVENQRQLLNRMNEYETDVKQLQENVEGLDAYVTELKAGFICHFSLCASCTRTYLYYCKKNNAF